MKEPKVPTPAELRERADRLEIEGRSALAEAKRLRHFARKLERLQETLASPSLTLPPDDNIVAPDSLRFGTVTKRARRPAEVSTRLAIGAKNTTRSCLFSDWLAATNQTATSWALDQRHAAEATGKPKWAASSVRSWMMEPSKRNARAVPEDAALVIASESKGSVPAKDSAWPNGISRPRRALSR